MAIASTHSALGSFYGFPSQKSSSTMFVLGLRGMVYKETFWMACDSTEQLRAEYGPFHTRGEAEQEAHKLGFGYLLRYEHMVGENEDIKEVRCVFIELELERRALLPSSSSSLSSHPASSYPSSVKLHTRCASCGESAVHEQGWQAEVWADIHEFEHTRHRVRLFEQSRGDLREIPHWRDACA
jgi:hypothetical protein